MFLRSIVWVKNAVFCSLVASATLNPTVARANSIFLQPDGSLNGNIIDSSNYDIFVEPGESITGSINLSVTNSHQAGAIVPVGATVTWGERETALWEVRNHVPQGTTALSVPISLTAPLDPGTYHLVVANRGECRYFHVMSATNWALPQSGPSCGGAESGPVWHDGNDLGWDWTSSEFQQARDDGQVTQPLLLPRSGEYAETTFGATWVGIHVAGGMSFPPSNACSICGPGPHFLDSCSGGPDSIGNSGAVAGIDLDLDCVADLNLILAPCDAPDDLLAVNRSSPLDDSANFPGSASVDGHTDVVDTEIVSMCLTGSGVTLLAGNGQGGVVTPSLGTIVEQPGDAALADSFFDVFFEVELPGSVFLYNHLPLRVSSVIQCLPPSADYEHVVGCIPLFDDPVGGVQLANIVSADHLVNLCGDGNLDLGEQCDDGNNSDADGCEADCTNPFCGNGIVDPPEECDDGNNDDGDGCPADCLLIPGDEACIDQGGATTGDTVEVLPGQDQMVSILGGPSVPGGIKITFEDTTGGTLEAGLCDDPDSTNFRLAGEPPLLWDITFDGAFNGVVTLVFGYDEAQLSVQESQLVLYHFTDDAPRPVVPTIVDQNANTITVTVDSLSLFALGFARAQEKDQQKCINALNKNLAKVAKAQGKSICDCIKDFAKGDSLTPAATLEACLTADRKGKVAKAQSKTEADEAKRCSATTPDFGATDSANVNDAALQTELDLIHDIFGSDLGTAIIAEGDDKDTSKCQQQAAKAAKKCLDTKLKEFNKCKKNGLKDGSIQTFVDLQSCMGADPNGKIAKTCDPTTGKVRSAIDKKCGPPVDTSTAFPGCGTGNAATLAACLDQIVECTVCLALNQADNLSRDCDDFDDGMANESCP